MEPFVFEHKAHARLPSPGPLAPYSNLRNLDFFSIDRPMWLRKIDARPQLGALPNARGVATRICASVSTQSGSGLARRRAAVVTVVLEQVRKK